MFKTTTQSVMPMNEWVTLADFQQTQPDDNQYQWLSEHGSMTSRLSNGGSLPLKINVLTLKDQKLNSEEQLFLGINERKRAYIREVIMEINHKSCLFGRTIIPAETLKAKGGQLKLLGEKPLGMVLFKNKLNPRLFIEVAMINRSNPLYPTFILNGQQQVLWARRSMFLFNNSPLMVQEVFLPNSPIHQPE